jgi:transposase InsO family protein
MKLKQKIMQIYSNSRKTYGTPRIYQQLLREGYSVSKKRVERLMQEMGIQALAKRKYKATTDSKHSKSVAQNHLNRDFRADRPNQAWVADITYIYTQEGWLYLATIMDLYSRKIIGWSLRNRLTKELVMAALDMALKQRKPSSSLLLHSDRGSQYASELYQTGKKWYTMFYEWEGELLGQCSDGEFLSHLKDRIDLSEKLRNENRSTKRHL